MTTSQLHVILTGMALICDGCGKEETRLSYRAEGPWAGRWICRECGSGKRDMTRLSSVVAFRFRLAQVLPPEDPATVPILGLMMAVDDVRRAQIQLVEAHERLDVAPAIEKYRVLGDFLYFMRLLFSHVHEAGRALRNLDTAAPKRTDELLTGNREALASMKALPKFFSSAEYKTCLVAKVRNSIGSHYDDAAVTELVRAEITDDAVLESTAARVGGLARMVDPLVRAIMNRLNDGDFMTDEKQTLEVSKALDVAGHLTTFVDHLFNALLEPHQDAVLERHEVLVDIPPLVVRAREAVDEARRRLAEEEGAAGP